MASNEGHVHWEGADDEEVTYLGQSLQITANNEGDPEGSLRIRLTGSNLTGLYLPNSTLQSPQWDTIPGTNPTLQARQDGHYPPMNIRVRQA